MNTVWKFAQDHDDLQKAKILAMVTTSTRCYGKTMDQLVAEELIKIRADRIEQQARHDARRAYELARQRGIDSVTATHSENRAPPLKVAQPAEKRRAARYQACIDVGLEFSSNLNRGMPRGIGAVAVSLGITRQSLTADLVKHIEHRQKKSS